MDRFLHVIHDLFWCCVSGVAALLPVLVESEGSVSEGKRTSM